MLIDNNWRQTPHVIFGATKAYSLERSLKTPHPSQNRRDDIKQVDAFKVSRKLLRGINLRFSSSNRRLNRPVRAMSRLRSYRNSAYDTIS
jgi:hypothetical protein